MSAATRLVTRAIILLAVLAVAAWLGLPALIAPTVRLPAAGATLGPPPLQGAVAVVPAPQDDLLLRLTPAMANALLDQLFAFSDRAAGSSAFVSAGAVVLGDGSMTLQLFGHLPRALPVPGWSGRPFQISLQVVPNVPSPDVLALTLEAVHIGWLPLSSFVSPSTLLAWVWHRVPVPVAGISRKGATVRLDLGALPPIHVSASPDVVVTPQPLALGVTPAAIAVRLRVVGTLTASPQELASLLRQGTAPRSAGAVPDPVLRSGSASVDLPAALGGFRAYRLTPSVPQRGLLRIAVADAETAPGLGLAAWLDGVLASFPPWLSVGPRALYVDFRKTPPLRETGVGAVRLLPTGVSITPGEFQLRFQVAAAAG